MTEAKKAGTAKDQHYARLRRAHRDSKAVGALSGSQRDADKVLLYGIHTVRAALDNPERLVTRMLVTRNAAQRLGFRDLESFPFRAEMVEPKAIDSLLGADAVHQGVVIEAAPRPSKPLSALASAKLILVLDQVTDPHNVGAIMRSAVAFGADALVTTTRHRPAESGVLAKAASGALEHIDHIEVRNLAKALEELHAADFQTVGLDSDGPQPLGESLREEKVALVLGAEGKGLRQKTREMVTTLAKLDLPGAIRSLNVSNAAAVSLYITRQHLMR